MLRDITIKPSQYQLKAIEADDLLDQNGFKDRIYGARPQVGERYRGIIHDEDGNRKIIVTNIVEKVLPLRWAVGMLAERGYVAQWHLIVTASGSQYAVAEVH